MKLSVRKGSGVRWKYQWRGSTQFLFPPSFHSPLPPTPVKPGMGLRSTASSPSGIPVGLSEIISKRPMHWGYRISVHLTECLLNSASRLWCAVLTELTILQHHVPLFSIPLCGESLDSRWWELVLEWIKKQRASSFVCRWYTDKELFRFINARVWQTDGQTDRNPIERPCVALYAVAR